MRTSFHDLERRISRIERQIQPPAPCNCRLVTHFHNAHCLAAILEKTERKCPVHGFREMGFLFQRSCPYPVVDEDNQFCPCPPPSLEIFAAASRLGNKRRLCCGNASLARQSSWSGEQL